MTLLPAAAAIRLADRELQAIVDHTGLTADHVRLLGELAPHLDDLTAEITQGFYAHVLASGALRAIIDRHSSVERLETTLAQYVRTLWSGVYDDRTAAHRVVIGKVHDRIQLPLGAYLGAFVQIDRVVMGRIVERVAEPELLAEALVAWRTLTQTDVAIVSQAFIDSRDARLSELLETLSAASEEVSAQTEEATGTVNSAVDATERGVGSIDRAWSAVENMRDSVGEVRERARQLKIQLHAIENIVETIGGISAQTKLLSLNARIEAARAGDQGRGFGVVAQEIGDLAQRTEKSLADISEQSTASEAMLGAVVEAVDTAVAEVGGVERATTEAREGFADVQTAAGLVREMVGEIQSGLAAIVDQAGASTGF